MRSPLRSPAQVEGTQGFLPQPGKALERPSSTRLEDRYIKTSDAVGLLPQVIRADNGTAVDLSSLEGGVDALVKQGESRWSTEGEGRVMRYKNLTRRVRIS